jgi:oxygen-independent coproporphyrinogen-3 oxidase
MVSNIDFSKFVKYSKAGPRYTSYPTALEFTENFDKNIYINKLKNSNNKQPLSIYVHLPFCRSACYFCGCNVVFTSKDDKKTRYIEYLKKELKLLKENLNTNREVVQLHFGGGTPTFFNEKELEIIILEIKSTFNNFSKDAEISCEIDPRYLTEAQMKVLAENGFNRVSFGVQDFNEQVQKSVHRVQSFDLTKNTIDLSRKYNMKSVNIDLIYGLPYQTLESFRETLRLSLELNPDRFAVFNYAHVPWIKKTMRKIDETTLPNPEEKLKIMQYTIDFFTSNGYKMIGMDHFAKPKDELFLAIEKGELHRNFQGYTTKGGSQLIGVGLTSIGEGENYYIQNYKDMKSYEKALDNNQLPVAKIIELNRDDEIRQSVIMELMANFKLDIVRLERKFNIKFFEYFKTEIPQLESFIREDLVDLNNQYLTVSATGTLLIRNISMVFDAYLTNKNSKKSFSKTI